MRYRFQKRVFLSNCLIIAILILGCSSNADTEVVAPDFSLEDLSGNTVSLNQYKGNFVLLDFWATWCDPCKKSIPELVELQEKYRDKGLVILGVSVDDPKEANDKYMSAFKEKYNINYTILRADQKVIRKYFGNTEFSVPTMFVINPDGVVVNKHVGYLPGYVEASLEKLLQ